MGFGASQLGIRAKVNDYLGSSVGVELGYKIYLGLDGKRVRSCIHFALMNGVYNMFVMYVNCEIVCLVNSIGKCVEH